MAMLYLKQVELSQPNAELRLLEVFYHKIYKVNFFYMGYVFSWSEVYTDYVYVGFPYRLRTDYIRISFSIQVFCFNVKDSSFAIHFSDLPT